MLFPHRISPIATTAICAAAIGLASVAAAGTAGASAGTADDAFLAQMQTQRIFVNRPQEAVTQGHLVCAERAAGRSGGYAYAMVLSRTNLSATKAAHFVVAATNAYCPQFSAQLN